MEDLVTEEQLQTYPTCPEHPNGGDTVLDIPGVGRFVAQGGRGYKSEEPVLDIN